jgi:hypothetical protein
MLSITVKTVRGDGAGGDIVEENGCSRNRDFLRLTTSIVATRLLSVTL